MTYTTWMRQACITEHYPSRMLHVKVVCRTQDEGDFLVGHRCCSFQTPGFDSQNFQSGETQVVGRGFADTDDCA